MSAMLADMDRLRSATTAASPRPFLISIPTTLSGAEYTPHAGVTDEATRRKDVFYHKDLAPDAVLLDPAMTLATPDRLWLSTGLRALDHAIESLVLPVYDALCRRMRLVCGAGCSRPGSGRSRLAGGDMDARLQCQIGSWFAIQGAAGGVAYGASPRDRERAHCCHGDAARRDLVASCCPHALRYNAIVNAGRQTALAALFGDTRRSLADLITGPGPRSWPSRPVARGGCSRGRAAANRR